MKALIVILFVATLAAAVAFLVVPRLAPVTNAQDKPESTASGSRSDRNTGLVGLLSVEPSASITGPDEEQLAQGESYDITWDARGLDTVTVTASADRTDYPGNDRGLQRVVIAERVPASEEKAGWKVPFIDSEKLRIDIKGYNRDGKSVASDDRVYAYRPDIFRTRNDDGIYIDVRHEIRQRIYVFKDNKLKKAYLTSGSRANEYLPRNNHPETAHDHDGVFQVEEKYKLWHSRLFDVDMYWAMRYWGGHFIHGTDPDVYDQLGTPASSGCNRLTKEQAKELYDMTPVGTRVEIIAK